MDPRLEEINTLLISYSLGDFNQKISTSDKMDEIDAFITNINMLGEELKISTISKNYFNNIFNSVSTMLFVLDANGTINSINKAVAETVSRKLGMDSYFAEVLPHQKLEKIKELQSAGEFVAMTGDGVNDAPALAQSDIGIAVGSGSDIAAETAGIILVNSNPKDIAKLILFGKSTYRKMMQNLAWATGYNVIALPLAAGVLYNYGILLSPAAGAALMSLSTMVVAINAGLLKVK